MEKAINRSDSPPQTCRAVEQQDGRVFSHPGLLTQLFSLASTIDEGGDLSIPIVGDNRLWKVSVDRYLCARTRKMYIR